MSKKYVYLFKEGNANMRELLGGKGANLAEMTNLGLPIPQGFTVTTEACTEYYNDGKKINEEIQEQIFVALKKLEEMQEDGTFDVLPKKEVILLKKEMEKLEKNLGGIKDMKELPGVMFIVDPKKERIGILEARKLGIPVIGLVDTNCNPEDVDYAIPGNDDAIRAVALIADCMANAVIEGKQGESMEAVETEMAEQVEETAPESIEEVVAAEESKNEEASEASVEEKVEE